MTAVPARVDTGSWWESAACRGMATGLFYGADELSERIALGVCRGCPARVACLNAAVLEERSGIYRFGIRGGTTARQRAALQRVRPIDTMTPVVAITEDVVERDTGVVRRLHRATSVAR